MPNKNNLKISLNDILNSFLYIRRKECRINRYLNSYTTLPALRQAKFILKNALLEYS